MLEKIFNKAFIIFLVILIAITLVIAYCTINSYLKRNASVSEFTQDNIEIIDIEFDIALQDKLTVSKAGYNDFTENYYIVLKPIDDIEGFLYNCLKVANSERVSEIIRDVKNEAWNNIQENAQGKKVNGLSFMASDVKNIDTAHGGNYRVIIYKSDNVLTAELSENHARTPMFANIVFQR